MTFASGTQFNIYLLWGQHPYSVLNLKVLEGDRGLLHDCETFANLRLIFISSSTEHECTYKHNFV